MSRVGGDGACDMAAKHTDPTGIGNRWPIAACQCRVRDAGREHAQESPRLCPGRMVTVHLWGKGLGRAGERQSGVPATNIGPMPKTACAWRARHGTSVIDRFG